MTRLPWTREFGMGWDGMGWDGVLKGFLGVRCEEGRGYGICEDVRGYAMEKWMAMEEDTVKVT